MDPAMAANPQPTYRILREQSPILRMDGHVMLTRWADIDQALRHPETFSSNWSAVDLGNVRPLIPLQIDPPNHVKYRRLLDPLFAPRKLARLEPEVAKLVNDLIDTFAGRGECDFSDEFAVPLPSQVFLTLLGLPLDDLDLFLKMKDGIIRPWQAVGRPQDSAEAKAYQREMATAIYEYFGRVLDEREQERRDDWLSMFLDASVDAVKLSREEILDICLLFLIAGLDTVTDSLECFFAYLAQHPSQRGLLVKDPSLIPSAVEEMLRWESPVSTIARVAVTDTEVKGCPIHAGEQVGIMIGSGNTDAERFDNPDLVDLARDPNPHIAFGGGVHRCLGSHLARLELRVSLREWHARIPDYSLPSGAELVYTPAMRSVEHLPLVFEPVL
jgi:cytochrome P450